MRGPWPTGWAVAPKEFTLMSRCFYLCSVQYVFPNCSERLLTFCRPPYSTKAADPVCDTPFLFAVSLLIFFLPQPHRQTIVVSRYGHLIIWHLVSGWSGNESARCEVPPYRSPKIAQMHLFMSSLLCCAIFIQFLF
jgi:hypothetical protein